jgi:hypothetical protein
VNFGDAGFEDVLDLLGSFFLFTPALRAANGEDASLPDEGGVNGVGAMICRDSVCCEAVSEQAREYVSRD